MPGKKGENSKKKNTNIKQILDRSSFVFFLLPTAQKPISPGTRNKELIWNSLNCPFLDFSKRGSAGLQNVRRISFLGLTNDMVGSNETTILHHKKGVHSFTYCTNVT